MTMIEMQSFRRFFKALLTFAVRWIKGSAFSFGTTALNWLRRIPYIWNVGPSIHDAGPCKIRMANTHSNRNKICQKQGCHHKSTTYAF